MKSSHSPPEFFLFFLSWMWLLLIPSLTAAEKKTKVQERPRPNIVFILADDLGYGDIEAFGGDQCNIDTPHFDALCRDGIKFANAHVTDSVCVPSRTSIMTGRYAFRFGRGERGGPWGFIGLRFPPSQHTLGDMFRKSGYRTGYVGKWHLGTVMTTNDGAVQNSKNTDFTKPLKTGPPQYGFDESFILPGSLDMFPYAFVKNNQWVGKVTAQKGWSAFNRVGPAEENFEDTEVLATFCREAARFIAEEAKRPEPFFLYAGLTAPHTPTSPESQFEGKSRIGIYGDFVMNTDACIGRINEALEAAGVAGNTLLMASSDHGPGHYSGRLREAAAFQMKEMEKDGHRANGPWRGYKFSAFEGGLRVPFAAKWPGKIPPGTSSNALIGLNDLMATWAEAIGCKLNADEGPDSISFLPILLDPEAKSSRKTLVVRGSLANAILRDNWKLILGPGSGSGGRFFSHPESKEAWKEAVKEFGKPPRDHHELERAPFVQLFNLRSDPSESENLAKEDPDLVRELIASLRKIQASDQSTSGPKLDNDVAAKIFRSVPPFVWQK